MGGRGALPALRTSMRRGTRSPWRKSPPSAEMRRSWASGRAGADARAGRESARARAARDVMAQVMALSLGIAG